MVRHRDPPDLGLRARLAPQEEDHRRACTLVEVGVALGVSTPRARQIEQRALQHFSERLAVRMAVEGWQVTDLLPDDT